MNASNAVWLDMYNLKIINQEGLEKLTNDMEKN